MQDAERGKPIKVERLAGQVLPDGAVMYDDHYAISGLVLLTKMQTLDMPVDRLTELLVTRVEEERQACLAATGWAEAETTTEIIDYTPSPHQLFTVLRRVLVRKVSNGA